MSDIFLSYSYKDSYIIDRVSEGLTRSGFSVWRKFPLEKGDVWWEIKEAVESSKMVVVFWSENSINSEWVKSEASIAVDRGKLIPVLISNIEIPLGFSHIQYVDFTSWNGSFESAEFQALVQAAYRFRNQERKIRGSEPDSPGDRVVIEPSRRYKTLPSASRLQVFLAHASADKSKLKPVVMTLIDQGFRLWVDKPQEIGLDWEYESRIARDRIQYGNDWKDSIRVAVKRAHVVLAFWSMDAIKGRREQFHYEVYMGMMQRKLHQCRIDKVDIDEIGMPYTFDHIADLSDIIPSEYHPELDYLMQDIAERKRQWWFL